MFVLKKKIKIKIVIPGRIRKENKNLTVGKRYDINMNHPEFCEESF